MTLSLFWDILLDAMLDSCTLLPFLFLTYLAMEWLEHKAGAKAERAIARTGRAGPLLGGALGLIPQCGFSAMSAGLFAGHILTPGTLVAVFLATSDEMLPIFLSAGLSPARIFTVLGVKFAVAVVVGFVVDFLTRNHRHTGEVADLCEAEHCHCEKGIFRSAIHHTLHIFLFVFVLNLLLGAGFALVGADRFAAAMGRVPILTVLLAALVGLIPNCAASVLIATLFVEGVISGGAMLAGLLTGAGAGLLVLYRTNRHLRENLALTAVLFGVGALVGCLFDLTGLAACWGL